MASHVLFIADSASQLKPAYTVASYLSTSLGLAIRGNVVPGRTQPADRQMLEAGVDCELTQEPLPTLADQAYFWSSTVVVAFLTGSNTYRLRRHIGMAFERRALLKRPVLVTGYNGLVFERHLEGQLWRVGYDFVCTNSRRDELIFRELLQGMELPTSALVRTGLPLAQKTTIDTDSMRQRSLRDVVFATQNVVPGAKRERLYLLEALAALARHHPDRQVIIKPRGAPGERTMHGERFSYRDLMRELGGVPENLKIGYGPLSEFLPKAGVLATVSSTAAFEALAHGVPAAILTDLGIKESLGNHFFAGSGMLTTIQKLRDGIIPMPNAAWLESNGYGKFDSLENLAHEVGATLRSQAQLGTAIPLLQPYYGPEVAPGLDELIMHSAPEFKSDHKRRNGLSRTPAKGSKGLLGALLSAARDPLGLAAAAITSRGSSQD